LIELDCHHAAADLRVQAYLQRIVDETTGESILLKVMALLREERSLEAVGVYRKAIGCTLLEALDAVDNIKEGKDPSAPRPRPLPTERWYRLIGPRQGQPIRQFIGFPRKGRPVEEWGRLEMGWPRVLILVAYSDHAMLYRYTTEAVFAGDTWAQTTDDARAQAEFEYRPSLQGDWLPIPDAVMAGQEHEWVLKPPS
jgi:hypothetical protein